MSKPPASDLEGDAGPDSTDKTDIKPKGEGGKEQAMEQAMEQAQEEAAEDRANEGGYQ